MSVRRIASRIERISVICTTAGVFFCAVLERSYAETWFGPAIVTPVTDQQFSVVACDVNRDGVSDAIAGAGSAFVVYLGDVLGHLDSNQRIPSANTWWPMAIQENDDGWTDFLCMTSYSPPYVGIWTNDHTGSLVDTGRRLAGNYPFATGDLDGDGHTDLLARTGADSVVLYYGSAEGLSEPGQRVALLAPGEPPTTYQLRYVTIRDLDGDGVADLIFSGGLYKEYLPQMRWRHGLGNRAFGDVRRYGVDSQLSEFGQFDLADLDQDGDLDVSVMWVGFEWGDTWLLAYDRNTDSLGWLAMAPSWGVPNFAYLDPDDRADLYFFRSPQEIGIYRGLGGSSFQYVQTLSGYTGARGPILGLPGSDFICVNYYQGPTDMYVYPNLVIPAGLSDPTPATEPDGLTVRPSIASASVRIDVPHPEASLYTLEILDVGGRLIVSLAGQAGHVLWDLRTANGTPAPSGVYYARLREPGPGETRPARITVAR